MFSSPVKRTHVLALSLAAVALFAAASPLRAAVVVIDFTAGAQGLQASYAEDGFEINPIPPNAVIELKEVNFDQTLKVIPGQPNRDDDILTKTGGGTFSLSSFLIREGLFGEGASFSVLSSAGGSQVIGAVGLYPFAGAAWTNVSWISFVNTANTTSSKSGYINVDDITLNDAPIIDDPQEPIVPEPGSLALLSVGALSCLGYNWRRRRASANV